MSHRLFPGESKMWMKLIFLEYPTFFWVTFEFRRRIANHRISKRKSIPRNWMNNKQRDVGGAFFNRWLVVDVPPGWQLVSQVLLALHITLLRGGIIGRVGRECCSVKVHYSFHHAPRPQLQPRMAPGLTQEAAPSDYHQHHLPLPPFPHFISLSLPLWGLF